MSEVFYRRWYMFTGCGTALVTPFRQDLSLDEATLRALVRRQIAAGINFVVPCGTTGESTTLSRAEHLRVVEITLEEAKGKVPVLAGAGGYNTHEVIELAHEIEALGADGILSVTPYYNKPTQEGLYQHYRAIAAPTRLPIVVYSVQGRTGVNLEPGTLVRLAKLDNIVGVKEASGNIGQMATVLHEVPAEMTAIGQACLRNDFPAARAIQAKFLPLMNINFVESNPIPVKAAMALMGLLEPVWRLPMGAPSQASLAKIETVLESAGLLVHYAS